VTVDRVLDRLEQLYRIGGGVGANRVGDSAGEQQAHDLAAGWMREAGLEVSVDGAGNLSGRHTSVTVSDTEKVAASTGSSAFAGVSDTEVWTGSHLDSVPSGGKFDGALGVVAGIEAVERLGVPGLAVFAFRDEERGCVGSRARCAAGALPRCFVELHVEQGPMLERAGAALGIVTSIAGVARGDLVVAGRADHAGTTPMDVRDDALVKAAARILEIRDTARSIEGAVATVGRLDLEPGFGNVVPGRVTLAVDARAPDAECFSRLIEELALDPHYRVEPVAMASRPRAALRAELEARRLPVVELPSGAGHDAGILAAAGVETAMLFVRSLNCGASHSPEELSSVEDIELAVDVLTAALARLRSP
jgi:acetylornithine deacetylase/succinyl-diaminopimelate desuccinylase-like protein